MSELVKKGMFVEIKFTGKAGGQIFDSNIKEDLEQTGSKQEAKKSIVIIGEGMLLPGLDKFIEGKEIGKKYEVTIPAKEGFGERKREFVKVIPLKVYTAKNINPKPGMVLNLDNNLVKIIAVSGARVTTDFNNPLSGKELEYNVEVIREVKDEKEKIETVLEFIFRFKPEYRVESEKVIVKGPKGIEAYIDSVKDKFKELSGKELGFESLEEQKKDEKPEDKEPTSNE